MLEAAELLGKLVSIPSVNPAFADAPREHQGEARLARWLADYLSEHGFDVSLPEPLPGRPNVIAVRGGNGRRAVGMTAHMDVVPAGKMSVPPFDGELRDGAVWGRGAVDTKGSMAAMITAALREAAENPDGLPDVVLLFTCDEESGFGGSTAFAANPPLPLTGMVVGEPTSLRLVRAHKGVCRTRLCARGVPAHASAPEAGRNAIYPLARAVVRLEELAEKLAGGRRDPLLGTATLNVGTIRGGTAVNSVPEECTAEVDRRLLPGEDGETAIGELRAALAGIEGVEVGSPDSYGPGFSIEPDHPWCALVSEALGCPPDGSVPFVTDACALYSEKLPCVVWGPGAAVGAHTVDEHLSVADLDAAVDGYRAILRRAGE